MSIGYLPPYSIVDRLPLVRNVVPTLGSVVLGPRSTPLNVAVAVALATVLAPVAVILNWWCGSAVVHWLSLQFVIPVYWYVVVTGLLVAAQLASIVAVLSVVQPPVLGQLVSLTVIGARVAFVRFFFAVKVPDPGETAPPIAKSTVLPSLSTTRLSTETKV